ncbi:MAG: DNA-binding transcriptional LysR family regulator [Oceanicoccus sp.]|jgi:DNA-binding transcriptional LysR family regulator
MVAETGGFTQTAERLGRTQPAISQQIKKLEELIGQPLFRREGQRAELTSAGRDLLIYARQILTLNDQVVGHFDNPGVSGRLRFGIPSEFAVSLLPKIVSRFASAYPNVLLEVFSDLSRNLVAEGQQNKYDLILALQDRPTPTNPEHIKTDELVWVTSARSLPLSEEKIPLIAAPDGCIYRQRALRKLGQNKKSWRIVYTNPDLTGIKAAIEEGMGVTVLARSTVPENLSIIESSLHLPKLGFIGISLKQINKAPGSAEKVLAEYVKAGLTDEVRF